MSVQLVRGDIFRDTADALVCPVNVVGTMGAGLARKFAERFPMMLPEYQRACRDRTLTVEQVLVWRGPRVVVCLATKADWRDPSRLSYVVQGLASLGEVIQREGWASVAVPALGAGLGRLPWWQVEKAVQDFGATVPQTEIRLYPPW